MRILVIFLSLLTLPYAAFSERSDEATKILKALYVVSKMDNEAAYEFYKLNSLQEINEIFLGYAIVDLAKRYYENWNTLDISECPEDFRSAVNDIVIANKKFYEFSVKTYSDKGKYKYIKDVYIHLFTLQWDFETHREDRFKELIDEFESSYYHMLRVINHYGLEESEMFKNPKDKVLKLEIKQENGNFWRSDYITIKNPTSGKFFLSVYVDTFLRSIDDFYLEPGQSKDVRIPKTLFREGNVVYVNSLNPSNYRVKEYNIR